MKPPILFGAVSKLWPEQKKGVLQDLHIRLGIFPEHITEQIVVSLANRNIAFGVLATYIFDCDFTRSVLEVQELVMSVLETFFGEE